MKNEISKADRIGSGRDDSQRESKDTYDGRTYAYVPRTVRSYFENHIKHKTLQNDSHIPEQKGTQCNQR